MEQTNTDLVERVYMNEKDVLAIEQYFFGAVDGKHVNVLDKKNGVHEYKISVPVKGELGGEVYLTFIEGKPYAKLMSTEQKLDWLQDQYHLSEQFYKEPRT